MAVSMASRARERCLLGLVLALVWLQTRSLRYRTEGRDVVDELRAAGRPVLLASWHGRVLLLPYHLRGLLQTLMVSKSRDGERIAAICHRFGYRTVRGSSSRAGARALLQFVRQLRKGDVGAHVVDGPRGPAGRIKPGLIVAAQRSGAAIVPIYASASRRWEARSWDRMQISWPFSRVLVRFGEPVLVPRDLDREASERLRLDLERTMYTEYARLERDLLGLGGLTTS